MWVEVILTGRGEVQHSLKQQAPKILNRYRLTEHDFCSICKHDLARSVYVRLNRQPNESVIASWFRMVFPVYAIPVMEYMIGDLLLPAPFLLREICRLPGSYTRKHL